MNGKTQAGIALGVIAAIAIGWALISNGSSKTACALTTAAVGTVIAGVTEGRQTAQIIGTTASGIVVPGACENFIDSLRETPDQTVTFDVQLPSGGTSKQSVPGFEVIKPPSPAQTSVLPPGVTIAEAIACGRWRSQVLSDMCLNGQLSPPT